MRKNRKNRFYSHTALPVMVLFSLFFLIPLLFTLSKAFFIDGKPTFATLLSVVKSPYTLRILSFTILESTLSAAVSILVAFPGAMYFARRTSKGKKFVLSLSTLCFTLPSILVVLGFVIFYGNSGVLNKALIQLFNLSSPPLKILYSFKAIIMAHAFLNIPVALSLITDYASSLSTKPEEAAATLGAKKLHIFFTLTLPRLLPVILSAFLLIFLFCFSSFAIILVLGGGPEYTTIEVEIYRQAKISLNMEKASAYACLSLCFNLLLLLLSQLVSSKLLKPEEKATLFIEKKKNRLLSVLFAIYFIILITFTVAPLISIVVRSFISTSARAGTGFSLNQYRMLLGKVRATGGLTGAGEAVKNSLLIALASAFVSTLSGLSIVLFSVDREKHLETVMMLPMAVSSVIIGLGFLIIKTKIPFYTAPLGYAMIIIAHTVITLPFAVKSLYPYRASLDSNFLKSAYTLGASARHAVFTLEIPAMMPAITKAFIFAFALSMGEVNATLLLAEGKIVTLPVLLYRLIGSYNFQGACALGTVLIAVTFLIFMGVLLFDKRKSK